MSNTTPPTVAWGPTEPRDRHEAHAAPPPPWNLEVRMYRGDVFVEGPHLLALKPDDPIRKLFEARPGMTQLTLAHDDGIAYRYAKVMPSGPPSYGMKTDEGNLAVDLATRTVAGALHRMDVFVDSNFDFDSVVSSVVYAVLGFADDNDVDMNEVESAGTKGLIRMRFRDYAKGLE